MTRKTKALKEHEIENYFIWQVEIMGGRTFKFKTTTQRGVSDRIACLPNGDTWFVELKVELYPPCKNSLPNQWLR